MDRSGTPQHHSATGHEKVKTKSLCIAQKKRQQVKVPFQWKQSQMEIVTFKGRVVSKEEGVEEVWEVQKHKEKHVALNHFFTC